VLLRVAQPSVFASTRTKQPVRCSCLRAGALRGTVHCGPCWGSLEALCAAARSSLVRVCRWETQCSGVLPSDGCAKWVYRGASMPSAALQACPVSRRFVV
jgi:hypothetical protein